jgi:hypothetical protein
MKAYRARCAVLVYLVLAASNIAFGTHAALAASAVHIPGKHMIRSGAAVRHVDRTPALRAAQPAKDAHDPFADLLLG